MTFEARTIEEIETAMLADKAARTELNPLNSASKAAIWRNIIYLFSVATHSEELIMERFQSDVEDRAAEIISGTLKWYAFESKVFQFGDSLSFIDGNVTYPVIDTTKYIVDLAAADVISGVVVIKVAKLDSFGVAEPLTAPEKTALEDYWEEKRFAGTALSVISQDGDFTKVSYRVGVDATVLNPANGESLTQTAVFPVEDAIVSFLQGFQAENFNSKFLINKLTDSIQAVTGVLNVIPLSVEAKPSGGAYAEIVGTLNEEYTAVAGWMQIDPAFPLSGTLTYYDFD
jgi:hypothetical protein